MSSFKRAFFISSIIAMALSLLVACGGSDSDSSSSATQAPQADSASETQAASDSDQTMGDQDQGAMEEESASDMGSDMDSGMDSGMNSEMDSDMNSDMDSGSADMSQDSDTTSDSAENPVTVGDDGVARLTIGSTDTMQYTVKAFSVEAGQQVELTLVHEGNLPVDVMGHNVVVLPTGGDHVAFAQQVMSGGGSLDNDYLPEGMREELVAYTDLLGGGESDTITFTAPDEPGEYPFLCTFPGHFGVMNGTMTVL